MTDKTEDWVFRSPINWKYFIEKISYGVGICLTTFISLTAFAFFLASKIDTHAENKVLWIQIGIIVFVVICALCVFVVVLSHYKKILFKEI